MSATPILVLSPRPGISSGHDIALIAAWQQDQDGDPTSWNAEVLHDLGCLRLANAGPCACNVEILLTNLDHGGQILLRYAQEECRAESIRKEG